MVIIIFFGIDIVIVDVVSAAETSGMVAFMISELKKRSGKNKHGTH
jgi:hypothetical protein